MKEKNICASEIMSDLNRQVRKWGLDVRYFNLVFKSSPLVFRCVSLSEAKVLKKPEGNNGIAPLLQVAPVPPTRPISKTFFTESWHEREVFLSFTHGVCQVKKLKLIINIISLRLGRTVC